MSISKVDILKHVEIGERVAEEEAEKLEQYFVETDQWRQMRDGNIDVVYGPKGSGKSALYTLLNKKEDEFFDRGILISSGENVRGATVFRSIVADPPPSELAFIYLWKLYCLTLIARTLREYEVKNDDAGSLVSSLEKARILPATNTLSVIFRAVTTYLKNWTNRDARSIEHAVTMDAATGSPTVYRKVEFKEQSEEQNLGDIPVDELLEVADRALERNGLSLWILFDRLDVAFADSPDLERNALRALFRAYNDLKAHGHISLKIFVRDDIWRRIIEGGFTEASHITKDLTISWDTESLLNLIVLRLLNNQALVDYTGVNPEAVRGNYQLQLEFFNSLVPEKVDSGKNPQTFGWMVSRTTDSTGKSAPRELIHLLDVVKDLQIKRLERGADEPEGTQLFERSAFKDALPEVSRVRYEQTLLAEHPHFKRYLQKLEGGKCEHTVETLSQVWGVSTEEASGIARQLADVGFFEIKGEKGSPSYWVVFLYRGALDLVQGKAEQ